MLQWWGGYCIATPFTSKSREEGSAIWPQLDPGRGGDGGAGLDPEGPFDFEI